MSGTFLLLWPQTGLRPRDPARGERFENIAYYGLPERLAPQLRSQDFERRMQSLGFRFRVVERNCWDDYRETDAVLAVRSFAQLPFDKFPPSKLYNSWFAGVPALLGANPPIAPSGAANSTTSRCTASRTSSTRCCACATTRRGGWPSSAMLRCARPRTGPSGSD